jgi:hypothetical protein
MHWVRRGSLILPFGRLGPNFLRYHLERCWNIENEIAS